MGWRERREYREVVGKGRRRGRRAVEVRKIEVVQTESMMCKSSHNQQLDKPRISSMWSDVCCECIVLILQFH